MKRVKRIHIQNILGIEDLEIEPGRITLIQGENASGKTSVLEAIKEAVRGGHDATLIRHGADEGEVVLVFDDDITVRKRIRRHGSQVDVRHPTMGKISAPQSFLNGLFDRLALNPVEFLYASDRATKLLEAMPLEVDEGRLGEALGDASADLPVGVDTDGRHALEVIEAVRKVVYDERTAVNRVVRENQAAAERLRESLPAESEAVDPQAIERLEAEKAEKEEAVRRELRHITAAEQDKVQAITSAAANEIERLREAIREVERRAEAEISAARQVAANAREGAQAEAGPDITRMAEEIAAARERLREAGRHENIRQMLDETERRAEEHARKSERLTEAIRRLDALKGQLLEELPIPGVEIRDGEVYRDGVPFPRMNTAEQVKLAVEVARLRAGDVPLACVDGMECLDQRTFDLFIASLDASGMQAVVTRVSNDPLTVEVTHNGEDE